MNASASKDSTKKAYPMYGAAEHISESVLVLMQTYGIRLLECRKLISANFEKNVVEAEFFDGVPQEIVAAGMLVRESLGAILASAGIIRLSISAEKEDIDKLNESYRTLVKTAQENAAQMKADAEGSGQTSSDGSDDSSDPSDDPDRASESDYSDSHA